MQRAFFVPPGCSKAKRFGGIQERQVKVCRQRAAVTAVSTMCMTRTGDTIYVRPIWTRTIW